MKQSVFTIQSNERLTESVCKMVLAGDTSAITAAGQFVNIQLKGFFLRRPISVCDYDENTLTILYKIVGKGTEAMSKMKAPHKLDILTGLGNGYDTSKSGDKPLLIGGGVGVPPMYRLAKNLLAEGKKPSSFSALIQRTKSSMQKNLKHWAQRCISQRQTALSAQRASLRMW